MSQTRSQMHSFPPFTHAETGCGLENTSPRPRATGLLQRKKARPAFTQLPRTPLLRFSSSRLRGYPHCTAPSQELGNPFCCLTCISTAASAHEHVSPQPSGPALSPGIKALLAMVVGEWRLPAAGQGRVCPGTLGLLLDPGGGAVESYCGGGGGEGQSRAESVSEEAVRASCTCSLRTGWVTGTASSLL